jgi:hypothetical protein
MLFYLDDSPHSPPRPRCLTAEKFVRLYAALRDTPPAFYVVLIDGPMGRERVVRHHGTGITFRGRVPNVWLLSSQP